MARIVVEVPEELKLLEGPIRAFVDAAAAQLALQRTGRACYAEFERVLEERSAELERSTHKATLSALDIDAPAVEIDGERHVRVLRGPTTFMTRAGGLEVERSLYRPSGARAGESVDLVAVRAGAVDGVWLPGTARAMAHLLQQVPAREAVQTAREMRRLPFSKASFERVGQAVAGLYSAREKDVDERLITAFEIPEGVFSVSAALDRVSIPVEEPRPHSR